MFDEYVEKFIHKVEENGIKVHLAENSDEAMQIYLEHLSPGGVLCAWMKEDRIIPHTIARVFPYADQYLNELVIASNAPIAYNTDYMENIANDYRTFVDQLYVNGLPGYPTTEKALSGLIRNQNDILEAEKDTPYLTDLKPWLEYYLLRKPVKWTAKSAKAAKKKQKRVLAFSLAPPARAGVASLAVQK